MPDPLKAKITPKQLGALASGGLVELETDSRRTVRAAMASESATVLSRVASDEDGNEYRVIQMSPETFDALCDAVGVETDDDRVRVGSTVWIKD